MGSIVAITSSFPQQRGLGICGSGSNPLPSMVGALASPRPRSQSAMHKRDAERAGDKLRLSSYPCEACWLVLHRQEEIPCDAAGVSACQQPQRPRLSRVPACNKASAVAELQPTPVLHRRRPPPLSPIRNARVSAIIEPAGGPAQVHLGRTRAHLDTRRTPCTSACRAACTVMADRATFRSAVAA